MAAELTDILGYEFSNKLLVTEALTHRSAVGANIGSYERLEFLGDRVLALVIADLLLAEFPSETEGALAKRFAELVRRETLAEIARKAGIANHIFLFPRKYLKDLDKFYIYFFLLLKHFYKLHHFLTEFF